jgi:hypothetical protein
MKYSELNLTSKKEIETFTFNDVTYEVKQYLPVKDKYDLIEAVLQKSKSSDGTYNELKLSIYFQLYLFILYSNVEFSTEDRIDEFELYDNLKRSGLLEEVISYIPLETEYNFLLSNIVTEVKNRSEYGTRAGNTIAKIINDLPKNAEAAAKIVENFDPKQYQSVIDFATAANGGRNIFTNKPVKNIENTEEDK